MICKIKNTEQNHSSGRGASLYTIVRPKVTGSITGVPHKIIFFKIILETEQLLMHIKHFLLFIRKKAHKYVRNCQSIHNFVSKNFT